MNYKAGRQNHDFQIAFFLVGSCHTADAAYALLKDQWEDRNNALNLFKGSKLREEAKALKARAVLDQFKDYLQGEAVALDLGQQCALLEAQADLADIEALAATTKRNLEAAEQERDFLQMCIDRLQPHRKFAHLTDAQAAQATQRDEWCLELMHRAENYLITAGTIPHDHYATMRMHPDFKTVIHPYTQNVQTLLKHNRGEDVLKLSKQYNTFDVMETLGLAYEPKEAVPLLPPPETVNVPQVAGADFRRRG